MNSTMETCMLLLWIFLTLSLLIGGIELRRRGMHRLGIPLRAQFERRLKLPVFSRISEWIVEGCILLPAVVLAIVLGPYWQDLLLLGTLALFFLLLAVRTQLRARNLLLPRDVRAYLLAGDFALLASLVALAVVIMIDG